MNKKGSIKKRLAYIIMLVTLSTGIIGFGSFLYWYMDYQYKKASDLSKTVVLILGQDAAKLLLLNDVSSASDITSKLKSFNDLEKLVLFNLDKKALYQFSKENRGFKVEPLSSNLDEIIKLSDESVKIYSKAVYQDRHLGFIEFHIKIESINALLKKGFFALLIIMAVMFLFSYILARFFADKFTNPILNLVKYLEKVDKVDFIKEKISTNENNEYGILYDEVNIMLDRIKSSQKELKLAAVAFQTQNGMLITDKNKNIIRINSAFSKITGYEEDDIIGKTPSVLKSNLHDQEFYDKMYEALELNHFWVGEVNNKHKNGNIVTEHLTIQAVLDDNKKDILYFVASFLDITKQKKIEKELHDKEKLLLQQSKMAQMGEMLENIAHQWRQPLSVISTSATGILTQKEYNVLTDQMLEENLESIAKSVEHLSQTVEDFRSFYKDHKHPMVFRIDKTVKKSISLVSSSFRKNNVKFIENLEPIEFLGFENELVQVFINIINNAKDELERFPDDERFILINLKKDQSDVIIEFKDSAGGIDPKIIEKVFDNHFTTKTNNGTGIGLYMSKIIVEKSNGKIEAFNDKIEVDDKSYLGACFKITVPFT